VFVTNKRRLKGWEKLSVFGMASGHAIWTCSWQIKRNQVARASNLLRQSANPHVFEARHGILAVRKTFLIGTGTVFCGVEIAERNAAIRRHRVTFNSCK